MAMRYFSSIFLCVAFASTGCNSSTTPEDVSTARASAVVDNNIDGVLYSIGDWEPHLPAGERGSSPGNHRALIKIDSVSSTNDAVVAEIKWRLPTDAPANTGVVMFGATRMDTVRNVIVLERDSQSGTIAFEPLDGENDYFAYYLPHETTGGYYPRVSYISSDTDGETYAWFDSLEDEVDIRSLSSDEIVQAVEIQSVDDFHSFFPMEVAASKEEVAELLAVDQIGKREFYYFGEDRTNPISMRHDLPYHWTKRGLQPEVSGTALQGEYFTFQIGIFSPTQPLHDVSVEFQDLYHNDALSIPASEITCFNCEGVDLHGNAFSKTINVDSATVQALWFGLKIPDDADAGDHEAVFTIDATNAGAQFIPVRIRVDKGSVEDNGDNEPEYMSRLAWLNSTMGRDPDFIIEPFTPVEVMEKLLSILGRDVALGPTGLPRSITSSFSQFVTDVSADPQDILAGPVELTVETDAGRENWTSSNYTIQQSNSSSASWTVESRSDNFALVVDGTLEYDGMLDYQIMLIAHEDADLTDVNLPVRYEKDAAHFILGLGHKGQTRPDDIDWRWDVANHQEGVWLGGINKGLQYVLRDDNYERPLNTNFYRNKPLNLPTSWYNDGHGGITVREEQSAIVANNYSGPRTMSAGDTLNFNIRFLITPFKPIDTEAHFNTRFVHKYVPVDTAKAWGGTVVNIHHANEINPYINYPFFNLEKQSAYIQEAHDKGVKVKLYNTIRELTYKSHELLPMRSLGTEIFNGGDGGGHSWLQEHLRSDYHSAWHAWRVDDAAILNKGTSRWTNYYIEGLNWLAKNQEIDGLYLDDIAFSRETVKRMVSVLHRHRDEVIIDLHSANQFNVRDGFINSAMLYMEHFPFVSRLWFGEYFEYDLGPDYWMTEVSGLPFGLMGEMLQGGGHPYRGMLYGMFTRYWGETDPSPVWNLMNEFEIDSSKMIGYWIDDAPVKTENAKVLATTYVKDGEVLIALASWSNSDEIVDLVIDWDQLIIDESSAVVTVAQVDGLQSYERVTGTSVQVPANMGLFLILE